MYARARECEYEKSIFDSDCNNPIAPNSPGITVRSEGVADETSTTPGTIRESSPENLPQVDKSSDRTDTDHPTLHLPTPVAQNMIYVLIQSKLQ